MKFTDVDKLIVGAKIKCKLSFDSEYHTWQIGTIVVVPRVLGKYGSYEFTMKTKIDGYTNNWVFILKEDNCHFVEIINNEWNEDENYVS